jgi:hypothetical protein
LAQKFSTVRPSASFDLGRLRAGDDALGLEQACGADLVELSA